MRLTRSRSSRPQYEQNLGVSPTALGLPLDVLSKPAADAALAALDGSATSGKGRQSGLALGTRVEMDFVAVQGEVLDQVSPGGWPAEVVAADTDAIARRDTGDRKRTYALAALADGADCADHWMRNGGIGGLTLRLARSRLSCLDFL